MSQPYRIDLGSPSLLEFSGPDAVRFLNGQLTQNVRDVVGTDLILPSCVTDAKGKLQFRVWVRELAPDVILVQGRDGSAEELEARLTRYLIADDVEVTDRTGDWNIVHFVGESLTAPDGVTVCKSMRFNLDGVDWWIPSHMAIDFPEDVPELTDDALEAFRIAQKVPAWDKDLSEGILPPEAGLDQSDISYNKGCYIGQEVISRIKSAGKVNKTLRLISFEATLPAKELELIDSTGKSAGEITSISPCETDGQRLALAYIKRSADDVAIDSGSSTHPCTVIR